VVLRWQERAASSFLAGNAPKVYAQTVKPQSVGVVNVPYDQF